MPPNRRQQRHPVLLLPVTLGHHILIPQHRQPEQMVLQVRLVQRVVVELQYLLGSWLQQRIRRLVVVVAQEQKESKVAQRHN
jgi:hypothetical protein